MVDKTLYYPTTLTEHFTWAEAEFTLHREIDNLIPPAKFDAVRHSAAGMESVRSVLKRPISISSWVRCPILNESVGSKPTSQHILGEAVDFICPAFGTPAHIVTTLASSDISFDQLILEHNWVHISFKADPNSKNRKQVLSLLASGDFAHGITDKFGNPQNG